MIVIYQVDDSDSFFIFLSYLLNIPYHVPLCNLMFLMMLYNIFCLKFSAGLVCKL